MKRAAWLLYLCTILTGCEQKLPGRWYTQTQLDLGRQVYADNCIGCHKENAQGIADWKMPEADGHYPPPPLNGTAHAWHHPLGVLKKTIHEGGARLGGKMPPFGDKLTEQETLAVIAYFQGFWPEDIYKGWLERGGLKQ